MVCVDGCVGVGLYEAEPVKGSGLYVAGVFLLGGAFAVFVMTNYTTWEMERRGGRRLKRVFTILYLRGLRLIKCCKLIKKLRYTLMIFVALARY